MTTIPAFVIEFSLRLARCRLYPPTFGAARDGRLASSAGHGPHLEGVVLCVEEAEGGGAAGARVQEVGVEAVAALRQQLELRLVVQRLHRLPLNGRQEQPVRGRDGREGVPRAWELQRGVRE